MHHPLALLIILYNEPNNNKDTIKVLRINKIKDLKGSQKKYLRGLSHDLKPAAFVGQKGITQALIKEINQGLESNELVKVKFIDFKERYIKEELSVEIAKQTQSSLSGLIGHVSSYYRQNKDAQKRKIVIPT